MSDKCHVCNGSGIETVQVPMPDGDGGYDWCSENRPCRECQ